MLEDGDPSGETTEKIRLYNRDDCISTEKLRDWLESRRADAEQQFKVELPRPRDEAAAEPRPQSDWAVRLADLQLRLTARLAPEVGDPDPIAKGTRLLSDLLDWNRREDKASWWRFFALITLSDDELFREPEPIAHLHWEGVVGETRTGKKIHRYTFPAQEHRVGNRSELHDPRLPPFEEGDLGKGTIDKDNLTLDIARPPEWDGRGLTSVVPKDRIPIEGLQEALARFAEWVVENGLGSASERYRAIRDLLLGNPPRMTGRESGDQRPLVAAGMTGSAAAQDLACSMDGTTLAIQGPPGSGKTYSGARMILELVRDGRRVGVTGSSHKVVANLLDEVWHAAGNDMGLEILERIDGEDKEPRPWTTAKDNGPFDRLRKSDEHDFRVIGGTVWLWAREELAGTVDTLFVDEAGQVALANVVAAGTAASNIVLLGDPQQLDQVLQGCHPPGAEKSSLGHYLGRAETIPADRGIFLGETWRMHPNITEFTSELFYEDKLESVPGLERQAIQAAALPEEFAWLAGSGLRWIPVKHDGRTNASPEEADRVCGIWNALIGREWIDMEGARRTIAADDIVIVSPFNAHRLLIQALLPAARVGTVDKFQGQQAPVSIYTMATSRPEDAPRGLDFLYSLNRLNVATSRARALAIVVASPALLDVIPRTPDQLHMANGLIAFAEGVA